MFVQTRSVSISSVCPTSSFPGQQHGERSKSVSERERGKEILLSDCIEEQQVTFLVTDFSFTSFGERRKSKKCSIFDTIAENVADKEISRGDFTVSNLANQENLVKLRKKSSKKVSIAENLNCDYSDVSDLHDDDVPSYENEDNCLKTDETSCNDITSEEGTDHFMKARVQEFVLNLIFLILFVFFKIIHIIYQLPVIITVILACLVLIKFYL